MATKKAPVYGFILRGETSDARLFGQCSLQGNALSGSVAINTPSWSCWVAITSLVFVDGQALFAGAGTTLPSRDDVVVEGIVTAKGIQYKVTTIPDAGEDAVVLADTKSIVPFTAGAAQVVPAPVPFALPLTTGA